MAENAQTQSTAIHYTAHSDMQVNQILSENGTVVITSETGSIYGNIETHKLQLKSGKDINVSASVDQIAAHAGGRLIITNTKGLVLNPSDTKRDAMNLTGLNAQDDMILQITQGDIVINEALTVPGNIRIAAESGNVQIDSEIVSQTGNITIIAGESIIQNANIATSGGTIDIESDSITMASGTILDSNGGNMRIAATKDITYAKISAGNLALIAQSGQLPISTR
jgi:hypothetical protein